MSFTKRDFYARSADGSHRLAGVVYEPREVPKGYFHIVHGMTEHIARYDRVMSDLAKEGYLCFGYDHLGHGKTAEHDGELGYIAKKDGHDLLCRDVKAFSDAVRAEYGEKYGKELPYYLMGHSMGSFIVRLACERYITPERLIVMGTGGSNPAAGAGILLIDLIKLFKGDKHISKFVDNLAFGGYNKRFEGEISIAPSPWLTCDAEERKRYAADKYCTFKFTVSAMGELMRLLKLSNRGSWYRDLPKMPILLLSGENDPVGNYGKGICEVEGNLKKHGHSVAKILYPDARHEILNDFTYEDVKRDILNFLS